MDNNLKAIVLLTCLAMPTFSAPENHSVMGVLQRVTSNKEHSFIEIVRVRGDVLKFVCDAPQCDAISLNKLIGHRIRFNTEPLRQPLYADGVPWAATSITEEPQTPARTFDFESYLTKPYVDECSAPLGGKRVM